ncbi:SDR family NAD(P)-dependent oxidoreductase [Actinoallomurus purpureus]|uniref:SDR family NAD(P)-dependent oxidoreductase n=1 Tax=Actinoallomurus purpureus TaxID=478114 RepID=UPI002092C907|nr:SDR family NAD(P)-dependent oxidoreductase [Actinoallomurus purpureus]MCO6006216.1 SDR family NAD(P)-dependent oxidoreductase [Actinoallomurus purpureus]
MRISGAKALVTGATGGIGQAIARELAARGASVVLTGRRADVLEPLAAELGGRAIVADLSDRDGAERLLDQAGEVDILVANAGLPATGPLTGFSLEDIDRTLDVNLRVPLVMARLAAEQMTARGRGHLVFVSSIGGKTATGGASLYNATKFGLRGLALGLREDLRPHGVGVSAIYPGFIRDAGMFADSGVTLPPGVGTRTPGDVARAVARAIERDAAEVDVAPPAVRLGVRLAALAPGLSARVQRLAGAQKITRALSESQRDKR